MQVSKDLMAISNHNCFLVKVVPVPSFPLTGLGTKEKRELFSTGPNDGYCISWAYQNTYVLLRLRVQNRRKKMEFPA